MLSWYEIAGCIGFTLVITQGSILDPLREWLLGFSHKWNVLRLLGVLLGCPMCAGVWVGVAAAVAHGHDAVATVAAGGIVSVGAVATDMVLMLVGAVHERVSGHQHREMVAKVMALQQQRRVQEAGVTGPPTTEEEADRLQDEIDRQTDAALGYPPA